MNTANTITAGQITALFRQHGLAFSPSIARITSGFTNEVYAVDDYILKVCVNTDNEAQFLREAYLYGVLRGRIAAPDPVVVDTSRSIINRYYMIYQRIEGEPAGTRWHTMHPDQRRQFTADLCATLRRIDNYRLPDDARQLGLDTKLTWKDHIVNGLYTGLAEMRSREILTTATQAAIRNFIDRTQPVLTPQKLGLVFWDVQFDNMLVDRHNRFAALIDFEGISIASFDYRLMIVRVMSERPHLFMSEEMEPYAVAEDYKHLLEWYREFYPELFDFPDIEKRLDLYELGDILDHLPAWPKTKQLHDRLDRILGGKDANIMNCVRSHGKLL